MSSNKNYVNKVSKEDIDKMRTILKLPEDLINKIVKLNHDEAVENALCAFINYDDNTKTYFMESDPKAMKKYIYTSIDSYNVDFNGYYLCEYDSYHSPREANEIRENLYKEFDAYCEIMKLILDYLNIK